MSVSPATPESDDLELTPNAKRVLAARYQKKGADGVVAETPRALFVRVAGSIASMEGAYGVSPEQVHAIEQRFLDEMVSGRFLPNSPTLMNAGRGSGMLSACFVIPVEDSIDSIFSAVRQAALVQKSGGGTGYSFSRLRPKGVLVASSGGTASGPVAFLRVFAEGTHAIQQGAFRRGANMGILRVDHPDIIDFIDAKQNCADLTNFNLSVAMDNHFMQAAMKTPELAHTVSNPRTGERARLPKGSGYWTVGEVLDRIVERAWQSGEPGLVFIDVMNAANPTPHIGEFESTNACGEQPLLPYESCNLGSLNLFRFVRSENGKRDLDRDSLRQSVRLATRFLDNVIDAAHFPLPEFDVAAKGNRKIGLGVMGFADMLFALGIPYDTEDAVALGSEIISLVNEESHRESMRLAEERGVFPNWDGSRWAQQGVRIRNACTTCVAPTGSISMIAGCSSGIEPVFALAFARNVLDGNTLADFNPVFEKTARDEGFHDSGLFAEVALTGSVQEIEQIPGHWRRVFVTAHDISPEWHVKMQAAFQRHCDASISKTINLKHDAGRDDVRDAFLLAYKMGCKGVTVYRNGCRPQQPMSIRAGKEDTPAAGKPIVLPDLMPAVRIKQPTPFGNMHVKVVIDPRDRAEREIFAQLGKGGDLANSDLEAICRMISLYLRIGGNLPDVLGQLEGIGSSLTIPTKDGAITSLSDGLAKAIQKYAQARAKHGIEGVLLGKSAPGAARREVTRQGKEIETFKVRCPAPDCGGVLSFEEGCVLCRQCGFSAC